MKNEYRSMELILWAIVVVLALGFVGLLWWALT